MTTITEILAEAFNRVKAEHGVTLSRVEYVDTGGVLGLNFKAAGSVVTRGRFGDGEFVEASPEQIADIIKPTGPEYTRVGFWPGATIENSYNAFDSAPSVPLAGQIPVAPPAERPKDATHIGSLDGGPNVYWRYDGMVLYWDSLGSWMRLEALTDTPHCQLVEQLTALANPDKGEVVQPTISFTNIVTPETKRKAPEGVTHYGSVDELKNRYWRFKDNELYLWDGSEWELYDNFNPHVIATLTPLT